MRGQVSFLSLLFLAVVSAFSPPNRASNSVLFRTRKPLTVLNSAAAPKNTLPFFDKLPWIVEREKEREYWRMRRQNSEVHRELGIAEGASYEDLTEATDRLIEEAGRDIKKKLKVEVAKDKILQIRLNERLAGLSTLSAEARSQSTLESEGPGSGLEDKKKDKVETSRLPRFLQGLVQKPTEQWRNRQIKIWAGMTAIAFLLPPTVGRLNMVQYFMIVGQLMWRGMPGMDAGRGGFSMFGGPVGEKSPHKRTAFFLGTLLYFAVKSVVFLGTPGVLATTRLIDVYRFAVENIGLATACMYLQTYKG